MARSIYLVLFLFLFSFTPTFAELDFGDDEEDDQPTKEENEERVLELIEKFVASKTTGPSANPIVADKTNSSKKILNKLESPVTMEWDEVELSEAVDELRELLDINIILHKSIPKDAAVSIKVKEMKGRNLLKWFLRMNDLRGSIQNGVLLIIPKEMAPQLELKMKIYNISDITTPIKNFKAPKLSIDGMVD